MFYGYNFIIHESPEIRLCNLRIREFHNRSLSIVRLISVSIVDSSTARGVEYAKFCRYAGVSDVVFSEYFLFRPICAIYARTDKQYRDLYKVWPSLYTQLH